MDDQKLLETKKFMCEHAALLCELQALCVQVSAMEVENKQREITGRSLAFNIDHFATAGDRMLDIADEFRKLV